ncbi:putative cyclin-dependent serine/threonine-protein kinase [Colletotrichum siamense]|uniref:putative cyclin-dependent serine/threonine-protein kinase n=1 Tax=Colletotrichum siamense TaxID=690259 RepID=UPI001872B59A|nr:putative cyclin-dependent serine/threonine-protein kinase [Colletotrichum siamense]KAF5486939.1 putative cyclin-dependent serine/threonine-protein kinase [Colletotrichum siamense]
MPFQLMSSGSTEALETSSSGTPEPEDLGFDDGSRGDRTAPSTPPQRSPRWSATPETEQPSPQAWPEDHRVSPSNDIKPEIEEPDTTLIESHDEDAEQNLPDDKPAIGAIDAIKANNFNDPSSQPIPSRHPTPSVVSDAGDQQWKELEARKQQESYRGNHDGPQKSGSTNLQVPHSGLPSRRSKFKLQKSIRGACQEIKNPMSTAADDRFLPKKQLYSIINVESVTSELVERTKGGSQIMGKVAKVAQAVCAEEIVELPGDKKKRRSYRQIFAILVLLDHSESIRLFMRDCVSDLDLPLVAREDPEFKGENSLYRTDAAGEPQGQPLACAEDWSDEIRRQFCVHQWMMLAPFFYRSVYNNVSHYTLKDHHRLPFVEGEHYHRIDPCANVVQEPTQQEKITSGFSQVYMVRIHSEHHEFHGFDLDPERGFAVKQLRDEDSDTVEKFKKEVNMLKKFTGDGAHPHVVSVLATYEQFGKFHLIFHRADGDLFRYWKSIRPNPTFGYQNVVWVAKQLAGLANGLLRFHRHLTTPKTSAEDSRENAKVRHENPINFRTPSSSKRKRAHFQDNYSTQPSGKRTHLIRENSEPRYGRHGDLKPENILWFPDKDDRRGILKITDFGQAELHSKDSKTYRRSNGVDTLTYRPPEGEIVPRTVRQSSDIWSLGCIYLEFVTWILGGADDLHKFKNSRLSYDSRLRMNSDTFFECVQLEEHEGAQLKPAVSRHIDSLASRRNCSQYFKDVLDLIRDMLVVESSDEYLIRRKSCGEVYMSLKEAYEKCLSSGEYATGLISEST